MKRGRTYDWIPLWRQKWLWGSTRIELDPGERSVWIDLLCIAGNDDGYIRANPDTPYRREQLAGMLCMPVELLNSAIEKCIRYGKLALEPSGALRVCSWESYQLDPRYKKRLLAESGHSSMADEPEFSGSNTEKENKKETDTEKEREALLRLEAQISEIRAKWNRFAEGHGIPGILSISPGSARYKALKARIAEGMDFDKLLEAIHYQPFLTGENDRGWLVSFDWILKPSNMSKILEGSYTKIRRGDAARRAPDDPKTGGRG